MKNFILASASPRRKELLEKAGFNFTIIESDKEGKPDKFTSAEKLTVRFALQKAEDVYLKRPKEDVVLGADTIVSLGGNILGKPRDREDAICMLKMLSGKTHKVVTGYALLGDNMRETGHVITYVTFNDLSDEQINTYVESGLCMGKAGSYGIQDGYGLVKCYDGDYDNVIGLPIEAIKDTIKEFLK